MIFVLIITVANNLLTKGEDYYACSSSLLHLLPMIPSVTLGKQISDINEISNTERYLFIQYILFCLSRMYNYLFIMLVRKCALTSLITILIFIMVQIYYIIVTD